MAEIIRQCYRPLIRVGLGLHPTWVSYTQRGLVTHPTWVSYTPNVG